MALSFRWKLVIKALSNPVKGQKLIGWPEDVAVDARKYSNSPQALSLGHHHLFQKKM